MADRLPGDGFMGWLGRQIGHVKKAVRTDPRPDSVSSKPASVKSPSVADTSPNSSAGVIYREDRVEEAPHPDNPGVKLRRTVIDEVIVDGSDQPT